MKLIFKQKMFSWFGSYDIFNENEEVVYKIKGEISLGHCLRISDFNDNELGMVKTKILSVLPKYEMYISNEYVGTITKEFSLIKPKFKIDFNNWRVVGNYFELNYNILDDQDNIIASISKDVFNLADTYTIDVASEKDALIVLMLVIAIDLEKGSRDDNSN